MRVLPLDQLPTTEPPANLDDICAWASWSAVQVATGRIDPSTARELNRCLVTLKAGLEKRDIERTQKTHERKLRALKALLQKKGHVG